MFFRSRLVRCSGVFFLGAWFLLGPSGIVFAGNPTFHFNDNNPKGPDDDGVDPYSIYLHPSPATYSGGGTQVRVPGYKTGLVWKHDLCAKVTNNNSQDIFVPVGNKTDFENFLSNAPNVNVSLSSCVEAACTGGVPGHSRLCGLEAAKPAQLVQTCGTAKCEYVCDGSYHYSSGHCCSTGEDWNNGFSVCLPPTASFSGGNGAAVPHCVGARTSFYASFSIANSSTMDAVFTLIGSAVGPGTIPATFTVGAGATLVQGGFGAVIYNGGCLTAPPAALANGSAVYNVTQRGFSTQQNVTFNWSYPAPQPSPTPSTPAPSAT